jgi:hypothetical protein
MYRMIYRVIQKERSIFREVILLVIVREKKVHMNTGPILVTKIELYESTNTKT